MSTKTEFISWWRTHFDESDIDSVVQAMRAERMSLGPVTASFEQEVAKTLDVPYVVATTSGSTAILLALMALDIGPGDEVIVPNRTWIATAHAPAMLGATVKVVDVLPDKPVMDADQLEKAITPKTKAIIPVPLNGRAVDMDKVWDIARKHNIFVVEDAAQGLMCKRDGVFMGTQSDAGCFSLSIAKLVPAGQGGFVVTRKEEVYQQLKRVRLHGVDDLIACSFNQMGFNFRYTDLQAAVALNQWKSVQQRMDRLIDIYCFYEKRLAPFSFLKLVPVDIDQGEVPIYIEVLCDDREKVFSFLKEKGVQTRPIYPGLETAAYLNVSGSFPNADVFSQQMLVLPCGPAQSQENLERVIDALSQYQDAL